MSDTTTLVIIRHGETEGNINKIITGSTDTDITENGIQQANELGKKLSFIDFDVAYSSDLRRAVVTAEEVLKQQDSKGVFIKLDNRINERGFRQYEEYDIMSLLEKFKLKKNIKNVYRLALDPTIGEPLDVVIKRVKSFLRDVYIKHKGENVLISTHAIVGLMMLNILLDKQNEIRYQENCCYNIIKIKDSRVSEYLTSSELLA